MRAKLRAATAAAHERLHRHPGLAAAATGAIDIDGYRGLLARLYGFHCAVDETPLVSPWTRQTPRSRLIERDLEALGVARHRWEVLPRCAALPPLATEAQALGALYVVEGSALGGAAIARAVAPLLAPFDGGSRFFSGDDEKGRGWPALLAHIETLDREPPCARAAIESAVATFASFEEWMAGWAPLSD
jgi:heme oxygenase